MTKTKKKIAIILSLMVIMGSIFTTGVLAQSSDSDSDQGAVATFFHRVWKKLGFEKDQTPAGSPMPIPSGTPSGSPLPQMKEMMNETALDKLVEDGKITEEQKEAILAEIESLMTTMQSDLKSWASDQGIDYSYVLMGIGGGVGDQKPTTQRPMGSPMPTPDN